MSRLGPWFAPTLAVLILAGSCAGAQAQAPATAADACGSAPVTTPLASNTNRLGVVSLHFFGGQGAPVTFFECVGEQAERLGERSATTDAITVMWTATFWRCGRLVRHFAATTTLPDGTFARGVASVRTPSCAQRFEVVVPRHLEVGRPARIRVIDRWGIGGVRTKLCIAAPRTRPRCSAVVFAPGVTLASRRVRGSAAGRWRIELRVPRHRIRSSIAVGVPSAAPKAPPPTVLATGDSTMQGIDSFLADDMGNAANVVGDVRPGLGMSLGNAWQPIAARQVARIRPRTTVISIGANEGFPMRTKDGTRQECCDPRWVAEYTRRTRRTMSTYRQRGRVIWLTLPAPADALRVPIFAAVNDAVIAAANGLKGVRILRIDRLFTPDGYREVIRYRGRDVRVREPDGIHLNVQGTAIAAQIVARALRAH